MQSLLPHVLRSLLNSANILFSLNLIYALHHFRSIEFIALTFNTFTFCLSDYLC